MPEGTQGKEADALALRIQEALRYDNYQNTDYIQWSFTNIHHYLWNKKQGTVEVTWDEQEHIVKLDLTTPANSMLLSSSTFSETEEESATLIQKALDHFNNDSFWIVAPYKLFDKGTTRALVELEDGTQGLLVSYSSGGSTPGDSYLWKVDQNYIPTSYQMWVSIIPIGGLEATWEDWTTTESGAYLPQQHKILGFGIPISNLRAWNEE